MSDEVHEAAKAAVLELLTSEASEDGLPTERAAELASEVAELVGDPDEVEALAGDAEAS